MSKQSRIALITLVLLAVALRTNGLLENTFQADEALFASWARQIAVWRDPLLKSQLVDKPPLMFYLQALSYPIAGPVMWAARIPNFAASILVIPLVAMLAWRLYRNEVTMLLASAFTAFSPMAIQFSSSGFIDPLMTCLVVASLAVLAGSPATSAEPVAAAEKRRVTKMPVLSGALFGLAVISKYQAWLFAPLFIGLALIIGWRKTEWGRWLLGLLPLLGVQIVWELLRRGQLTLIESQWQSFGGIRLAWSWELWPRLEAWAQQYAYILGSPILEFLLLLAVPLFAALLINESDRAAALDRLLAFFVVAYLLLLWFIAVPVWDRYLLAIVPFVSLVLARAFWLVAKYAWSAFLPRYIAPMWIRRLLTLLPIALMVIQAPALAAAYSGQLPVGTSPSADYGAAEISALLAEEPYGTVLYDHWFSWQWRYHLFDDRVYVSWFPNPDALIEDLQVFGQNAGCRYIVLPDSEAAVPVTRALTTAGYRLERVIAAEGRDEQPSMLLYLIKPSC